MKHETKKINGAVMYAQTSSVPTAVLDVLGGLQTHHIVFFCKAAIRVVDLQICELNQKDFCIYMQLPL
jgi:hypothetical protein